MDVPGAVFIITGSATGLGATVAQQLAAKGGRIVVNYTRSLAEAEATAAACRNRSRRTASGVGGACSPAPFVSAATFPPTMFSLMSLPPPLFGGRPLPALTNRGPPSLLRTPRRP